MEETDVILARHEQRIKTLEREMVEMKTVQAEIRSMNDTLVTLTTELKHANEHLARLLLPVFPCRDLTFCRKGDRIRPIEEDSS